MSKLKRVILVAEDSAPNRKIVCQLLLKFGFEVIECVDGEDAYNKAVEALTTDMGLHAIISDIMMPKMSGLEFVGRLKSMHDISSIPTVFLTAVADKEHVMKAKEVGARGYILKPVTRDKLQKKCSELFPDHEFPLTSV